MLKFFKTAVVSLLIFLLSYSLVNVNEHDIIAEGSDLTNADIDVTDFGAVPNDDSDDLESFEKAIEASVSENKATHVPAGTYDLYGYISLRNNTILEGENQNSTIIIEHRASKRNHMVRAQDINNIKIANLTLKGTGAGNSGDCVHLENVNNYTIQDLRLFDCGSGNDGAGIFASSTSRGYVIKNTINASRNGYLTPQSAGSVNIVIAYNKIMNSIDDAIHPQSGSNNRILGNIAIDSGDDDIDLWNESNTLIENNTVINSVISRNSTQAIDGIEIGDGSTNIVTKNNRITGPLTNGINIGSSGNPSPNSSVNKNISITDNQVNHILLSCIALDDAEEITIAGNRLGDCNLSDPIAESAISVNAERTRDILIEGN
jgi:parallel beta-helix repeat protein